jgi:uncharacterized repeat protein (TIGR01451 family)
MGVDIDELYVGEGYDIQPNATTVDVLLGTERDQYFPGIFTFSVRVKDPTLVINKQVEDQNNNNYLDPYEELTFTLSGSNVGKGNSYNTFVTDTLPANVQYIPGSFEVITVPGGSVGMKTDLSGDDEFSVDTANGKTYLKWKVGIGASAENGGELPVDSHYLARFKVKAPSHPSNVINLAQIVGESFAGELFTDESTASITVNFSSGTAETHIACDSFYWKGVWYTSSGTYYYDYMNTAGLPATDTLYLTIKKSTGSYATVRICAAALPYQWNGLQLTAAGVQTIKFTNAAGCDSIATLDLIVNPATSGIAQISVCQKDLPYVWNGFTFNDSVTQTISLLNQNGCDSLVTLKLTVVNCDPPCSTENFNKDSKGWILSNGARFTDYLNPINNCRSDTGIITPGVGGFDPAKIRTPLHTSSGAKKIKLSFDLFPFDANMRCNSWKDYNCIVSIDVYYYVGTNKFIGAVDYILPPNGPANSPTVTLVFDVNNTLPAEEKYSIEIIFKRKNGVGKCVQQNTKYIIDNVSICELQCAACPVPSVFVNNNIRSIRESIDIFIWPNPASDRVNITVSNMVPTRIDLFDTRSKQVLSVTNQASIDVSRLISGIYIAKIYKANLEFESRQIQVIH